MYEICSTQVYHIKTNMFHKFDNQKVTQKFVFTLNNICIVLYLYINKL